MKANSLILLTIYLYTILYNIGHIGRLYFIMLHLKILQKGKGCLKKYQTITWHLKIKQNLILALIIRYHCRALPCALEGGNTSTWKRLQKYVAVLLRWLLASILLPRKLLFHTVKITVINTKLAKCSSFLFILLSTVRRCLSNLKTKGYGWKNLPDCTFQEAKEV